MSVNKRTHNLVLIGYDIVATVKGGIWCTKTLRQEQLAPYEHHKDDSKQKKTTDGYWEGIRN